MPDTREAHLLQLLWMERSTAALVGELSVYPWDREHDLVRLTAGHVAHALERFADGHIGAADLAAWARTVADREDIDQDPAAGPGSVVNDLTHPERLARIDAPRARRLAAQLRRDAR
jgi:hypothetical protein